MAWAADYTQASDLASIASGGLHYEIFYAVAERQKIIGGASWCKLPPAGCLPFQVSSSAPATTSSWPPGAGATTDAFSLRWVQEWIEANCASFVRDTSAGAYDGDAAVEMFTLANLRTDAGLNASGFTRHVPDGAGSYTTEYGLFAVGDYVCPHLWNEIKACLKLLTATTSTLTWTSRDPASDGRYGEDSDAALANAQSGAETDFDADADAGFTATRPQANTEETLVGSTYTANMARVRVKGQVTLPGTAHDAAIDFYARAVKTTSRTYNEFAGGGDFDGYEGVYQCVEQGKAYTAGGGATVTGDDYSGPSATTTRVVWPATDPAGSGETSWCGYYVDAQVAVVRYTLTYGAS